jgi:hypothetical protein
MTCTHTYNHARTSRNLDGQLYEHPTPELNTHAHTHTHTHKHKHTHTKSCTHRLNAAEMYIDLVKESGGMASQWIAESGTCFLIFAMVET